MMPDSLNAIAGDQRVACLCQSALLLPLDSAHSAAADDRFRRHSADLLPRAGAPGPPPAGRPPAGRPSAEPERTSFARGGAGGQAGAFGGPVPRFAKPGSAYRWPRPTTANPARDALGGAQRAAGGWSGRAWATGLWQLAVSAATEQHDDFH